ncbi:MAG TPA: hypothetical protein VF630_15505 [Hymenobacter sp.]
MDYPTHAFSWLNQQSFAVRWRFAALACFRAGQTDSFPCASRPALPVLCARRLPTACAQSWAAAP